MKNLIAFLFLVAILSVSGTRLKTQTEIIGGWETDFSQHNYMVKILDKYGSLKCAGALLSENVAITAASCFDQFTSDTAEVKVGDRNKHLADSQEQSRGIANVYTHPQFDKTIPHFDYVIMVLDSPVKLGSDVGTIELRTKTYPNHGQKCKVFGWGVTINNFLARDSHTLTEGTITYFAKSICKKYFSFISHDSQLCTGQLDNQAPCSGDQGSPLVCPGEDGKDQIVGVYSFKLTKDCLDNYPHFYGDILPLKGSIDSIIQAHKV